MEHTRFKFEINKAIAFAAQCHQGQYRKDGLTPYIVHPFAVLNLVKSWGVIDLDAWVASLCHDIREECDWVLPAGLINHIGEVPAGICEELTFIPDTNNPIPPSKQKEEYMKSFNKKSIIALVVKLADRICNSKDFLLDSPAYAYKYWTKADSLVTHFYERERELVEAFGLPAYLRMDEEIKNTELVLANAHHESKA
jgi:(p)ppGpp synthase/HD superfamily hydrolase